MKRDMEQGFRLPMFVDHLVFRVGQLARTEQFDTALLGPPCDRTEDSLLKGFGWQVQETCSKSSYSGAPERLKA